MIARASDAYRIEPVGKSHDRSEFSCGSAPLDRYLQQQARQDADKHVAASFVLVEPPSNKVLGYYTLSSSVVDLQDLPADVAKKLPRYPYLPVTLLGRLALDSRLKGRALGELLLMDALHRSLQAAQQIGAIAVLVDAKDAPAKDFYAQLGFIPLRAHPMRLFLPMRTINSLFG